MKLFLPSLIYFAFILSYKTELNIKNVLRKVSIILPFIIYSFISVLWSENKSFGALKNILIVANLIPYIILLIYYRNINIEKLINVLTVLFIVAGNLLAVFLILTEPVLFVSYGIKQQTISHVISGKIISITVIILVLKFLFLDKPKPYLFISFILNILAICLIPHRTSLLAIGILIIYFIIILKNSRTVLLTLSFLILITGSYFLTRNLKVRFEFVEKYLNKNEIVDQTVQSRILNYKHSIKLFLENPIIGAGAGGFRILSEGTAHFIFQKYPHNIILELLSEGGIIGFTLFFLPLCNGFKNLTRLKNVKKKISVTSLFLFFFISALFTKDLATNSTLLAITLLIDNGGLNHSEHS